MKSQLGSEIRNILSKIQIPRWRVMFKLNLNHVLFEFVASKLASKTPVCISCSSRSSSHPMLLTSSLSLSLPFPPLPPPLLLHLIWGRSFFLHPLYLCFSILFFGDEFQMHAWETLKWWLKLTCEWPCEGKPLLHQKKKKEKKKQVLVFPSSFLCQVCRTQTTLFPDSCRHGHSFLV